MEEMVELFLPFFFFVSCISAEISIERMIARLKMMKKRMRISRISRFFTIFAKNTAHNERRLRKNAYLCIVAENPSQT